MGLIMFIADLQRRFGSGTNLKNLDPISKNSSNFHRSYKSLMLLKSTSLTLFLAGSKRFDFWRGSLFAPPPSYLENHVS